MRLGGNLSFGNVQVSDVRNDGLLVITNDGNSTLTISGLTAPAGGVYTATWASGTISPGATQNVGIRFAPTAALNYSGVITVSGDQTSGTNTIAVLGVGTAPPPSGGGSNPSPSPVPSACSYSLNPSSVTLGTSGSFVKATLQLTTTNCAWSVSIADSWLTAKQNSGIGSAFD